ncbi:MAG: hypothetical protein NC489_41940 [Ruminococcus flavefaciens]|nr:hypothetical protein [Ruminococcus flavefaciens]
MAEVAIIRSDDREEYYFFDEPVWGEDLERDEVYGVLQLEDAVGTHECLHSCMYDGMDWYADEVQDEGMLPERGLYIVTYFRADPFGQNQLEQLVDFGITKKDILRNIRQQRYREGARYFLMEQLERQGEL